MDLGLTGKTAVASGSTAGIGFAIAATLAQEGARVVVHGRTEARLASPRPSRKSGSASGMPMFVVSPRIWGHPLACKCLQSRFLKPIFW
jgi:NAD(P)-dependent dehydrogenase (short-subunit alcohol dehydrogenase family)